MTDKWVDGITKLFMLVWAVILSVSLQASWQNQARIVGILEKQTEKIKALEKDKSNDKW